MRFLKKKVSYETLADKLTRAREEQSIGIDTAERFTEVQRKYLEAIEDGAWHLLPGEVYAENFIRRYAQFLGFDERPIITEYRRERKITKNTSIANQERDEYRSMHGVSRRDFFVSTKAAQKVISLAILAGFFAYLGLRINDSLSPPNLELLSPRENLIVNNMVVRVAGTTEPEVDVWINDLPILTDQQGNFAQIVELTQGINEIHVSAQKKHSKRCTVERTVLVVPDEDDFNALSRK